MRRLVGVVALAAVATFSAVSAVSASVQAKTKPTVRRGTPVLTSGHTKLDGGAKSPLTLDQVANHCRGASALQIVRGEGVREAI